MSAPGFGYSAGDFIAAVGLIAKVTKALKDAGGAREEYQALVSELGLLNQILEKLPPDAEPSKTDDDASSDALANFARQQTKVTISELTQFLERISKFGSSMGGKSKSGWRRSVPRKTQWAVYYADEVEKMRAKLGTQLQIILVALSVDGEQFTRSPRKQITSTEQTNYATKDEIQTLFRYEWTPKIDQVLSKSKNLEAYNVVSAISNPETTSGLVDVSVESQANFLDADTRVDHKVSRIIESTGPQGPRSSRKVPADEDNQALLDKKSITEEDDIKKLLVALLRAMTKSAQQLLLSLWKLLPQYIAFFQLLSLTIRREPMLAAADCINFEDMLGRKFYLNFEHYKHWAASTRVNVKRALTKPLQTFEAFLGQQFRNVPGQRHVSERQYRITRDDALIPEGEWAQTMKPGSDVEMSGLLLSWKTTGEQCPKPGCPGKGSQRGQTYFFKCSECNLIYACGGLQGLVGLPVDLGDIEVSEPEPEPDDDEKHFRRIHVSWETWHWPVPPPAPRLVPTIPQTLKGKRPSRRVSYRVSEENPQMLQLNQGFADRLEVPMQPSYPNRHGTHAVEVEPAQSRPKATDHFRRTVYRRGSFPGSFPDSFRGYSSRPLLPSPLAGPGLPTPPFPPFRTGHAHPPFPSVGHAQAPQVVTQRNGRPSYGSDRDPRQNIQLPIIVVTQPRMNSSRSSGDGSLSRFRPKLPKSLYESNSTGG